MKKRIIAIIGIVALIALIIFVLQPSQSVNEEGENEAERPDESSRDVVVDFYEQWLAAAQSTSTDPYASGVPDALVLTDSVRTYINNSRAEHNDGLDPVLCQTEVPPKVRSNVVFETDTEAQVLITAARTTLPGQAIVSLAAVNGDWLIVSIECSSGETAPEQEYSFTKTGQLLKGSVPEPYDAANWHLVFAESGAQGLIAPLYFDSVSVCVASDGTESVCDPNTFAEADTVFVQGNLTETGVNVVRMEHR